MQQGPLTYGASTLYALTANAMAARASRLRRGVAFGYAKRVRVSAGNSNLDLYCGDDFDTSSLRIFAATQIFHNRIPLR